MFWHVPNKPLPAVDALHINVQHAILMRTPRLAPALAANLSAGMQLTRIGVPQGGDHAMPGLTSSIGSSMCSCGGLPSFKPSDPLTHGSLESSRQPAPMPHA